MSERKQQILQTAIDIIAAEGYAGLTMRALARASGMKLGALQYHFATWEALLTALAAHIATEYRRSFDASETGDGSAKLRDVVALLFDDDAGDKLQAERLWPQLWAMAQVEPVMKTSLEKIYDEYLQTLEQRLAAAGSQSPRAEALGLMSLLEGSTLFVGSRSRWAGDADALRNALLAFVDARYCEQQ